jgi:PKD repeat protein
MSTNTPTVWVWNATNVAGNNTPFTFSTSQSPTQVFGIGNFSISLKVANSGGANVSTQVTFINVSEPAPVASFTPDKTTGTSPLTITFTDDSTNTPTVWIWNATNVAGNNTPFTFSTGIKNPSQVFGIGNFSISLTAANSGGSNVSTQVTFINVSEPAPVASFESDKTSGIAPLTIQFSDKSTNSPTAWNWNFGDGLLINATEQHPVHTYSNNGTYSVSLTATNAGGSNTISRTNYITVIVPAPVANFSANVTSGTYPLAVGFTDLSIGTPSKWNWSFGDGSFSALQHPTHTYIVDGNYTVSLNATNAGGSNTKTVSGYIWVIIPIPAPVSDFSANVTEGLSPRTIQFTDRSTGSPTGWYWSFGDNDIATVQNPVHTYVKTGNHTVTMRTSNEGGTNTTMMDKYIKIYPKGDFNHNWQVDIGDIARVASMVVGRTPLLLPDADFNNNGILDIGDAAKIAWYGVGKIPEL